MNGKSVIYGDFAEIDEYLQYDFNIEKSKKYSIMSDINQVKNISKFVSNIWEIHPFAEGNTRTIAVFVIKYLNKVGFNVNNSIFIENSKYFRNALVLANFSDVKYNIDIDSSYLESFFSKLMIDNKIQLKEMKNPFNKQLEHKKDKNNKKTK